MRRFGSSVFTGALVLMLSGILSRVMGFFYRVFLSHAIGEEGMGVYQLSASAAMLFLSLCTAGFQTSISRFVAGVSEQRSLRLRYFACGIVLCLAMSLPASAFLYVFSGEIASGFLMEPDCQPLLEIIALSIPLASLHSCVCGYYFGCRNATLPALSQLIEQLLRVGSVWIVWGICTSRGTAVRAVHAAAGTLIGEMGSVLFLGMASVFVSRRQSSSRRDRSENIPGFFFCAKKIFLLALPLTANRLVLSFFQSLEGAMIPGQLRLAGMEQSQALSVFGVLTGMVMPFLFFPATLTTSVSLMLLPSISFAQSQNDTAQIQKSSGQNLRFCLWLGIFSCGTFLLYGGEIGEAVYHSPLSGHFMETLAWLCPFLYLTPAMGSILSGLGQTKPVFFHNLFGLFVRLLSIFLLIPPMGIRGYLLGLLASQILTCILHFRALHNTAGISFFSWSHIGVPVLLTAAAGFTGKGISLLFLRRTSLPPLFSILAGIAAMGILFLGPAAHTFFPERFHPKKASRDLPS